MNVRPWISAGVAGAVVAALLIMVPATSAGAAGSYVSLSPNPLNFGRIPSGTSKLLAAEVTNTSSQTIKVIGAASANPAFSDDATSAPGVPRDGACSYQSPGDGYVFSPVAAGDSCLVYYRFSPTADGFHEGQVRITVIDASDDSQLEDQFLDLEGLARQVYGPATTGGLTLSPAFVDFVDIMIGETASKPLTVTNTSNGMVQVTTSYSPGQFRDRVGASEDGDCVQYGGAVPLARKLDPGDSCTVQVEYAPTTPGSTAAFLTVGVVPTSGDPGDVAAYSSTTTLAAEQLRVSGNGRGLVFTASSTKLAFGSVARGTTKVLSTVIKNTDPSMAVQFDAAYPAGSQMRSYDPATPASTDCVSHGGSRVVQPGQTCSLRVEYAPTANGAISNVVTVRAHPITAGAGAGFPPVTKPTAGSLNVTATGTGLSAKFSAAPSSLSFWSVTVTGTKTLIMTMRNTGTGPLEFGFPSSGTGPFSVDLPTTQSAANCLFGTRHQVIAAGKSCTVTVRFSPSATGATSTTIPVQALSPGDSAVGAFDPAPGIVLGDINVKATGTGIAPRSTLSPTSVAFGNVTLQGTKKVQVTVKNTSTATVTYRSTHSAPGPYQVVTPTQRTATNCSNLGAGGTEYQAIAPGKSCVLTFSFSPTALGAAPATTFGVTTSSASTGAGSWGAPGTGLASKSLRATGKGVAATFTSRPSTLYFGSVNVGASKILKTTVKNTSTTPLRFAVSFPAGSAYHRATTAATDLADCIAVRPGGTTYMTVAVGASCNLRIEYRPTVIGSGNANFPVKAYASAGAAGTYSPAVGTSAIGTKTIYAYGRGS